MTTPTFSIIIPTCHRPDDLARCLHSLNSSAEVIVTDDSRDEATCHLIERDFPTIRWIPGPRRGPATNRNHGARHARGEWLAFLDDDCEPQPGWIEALAAATTGADVIEGRTVAPGAKDTPFEEHIENTDGNVLWSCNLAIRRELFERLGGFDEDFAIAGGEDMELAWRIRQAGLRVTFARDALVHHPPRWIGWRGLWRRLWDIRWMSLYRVKTGQSQSWPATAAREFVNLLRSAKHLVTKPEPGRWRRRTFAVCWRGVTFPIVLPWILYWEHRYRAQFR